MIVPDQVADLAPLMKADLESRRLRVALGWPSFGDGCPRLVDEENPRWYRDFRRSSSNAAFHSPSKRTPPAASTLQTRHIHQTRPHPPRPGPARGRQRSHNLCPTPDPLHRARAKAPAPAKLDVRVTVFVDPLTQWNGKQWCHMGTDGNLSELHAISYAIKLKRCWFQAGRHPHYDLRPSKRALAIKRGAVPVGSKEFFRKCYGQK